MYGGVALSISCISGTKKVGDPLDVKVTIRNNGSIDIPAGIVCELRIPTADGYVSLYSNPSTQPIPPNVNFIVNHLWTIPAELAGQTLTLTEKVWTDSSMTNLLTEGACTNLLTIAGLFRVDFYVVDAATNAPIFPAYITFAGTMEWTDSSGHVYFEVPAGTYNITITASGYESIIDYPLPPITQPTSYTFGLYPIAPVISATIAISSVTESADVAYVNFRVTNTGNITSDFAIGVSIGNAGIPIWYDLGYYLDGKSCVIPGEDSSAYVCMTLAPGASSSDFRLLRKPNDPHLRDVYVTVRRKDTLEVLDYKMNYNVINPGLGIYEIGSPLSGGWFKVGHGYDPPASAEDRSATMTAVRGENLYFWFRVEYSYDKNTMWYIGVDGGSKQEIGKIGATPPFETWYLYWNNQFSVGIHRFELFYGNTLVGIWVFNITG